jgi:8-hydroxy-5-deazaflavin:NADPH oxidoreductase
MRPPAHSQNERLWNGGRPHVRYRRLVCADDAGARAQVIGLIQRIGLRGIDAGPICNSAAAEALTSLLIHINRKYKVPGAGIRITGIGG